MKWNGEIHARGIICIDQDARVFGDLFEEGGIFVDVGFNIWVEV